MTEMGAPLERLLDAIAAREPTPGGGAVAAWIGATGAALGLMVVAYSIGRQAEHEPALAESRRELEIAKTMFMRLGEEDAAAYSDLSGVLKLDKTDESRAERLAASVRRAIEVPSAVAATALNVLRLMERLGPMASPYLRSDLAVAAGAMEAAVNGAVWMVRANLPLVADSDERAALEATAAQWRDRAASSRAVVDEVVTRG